jgi:hypothetical protein
MERKVIRVFAVLIVALLGGSQAAPGGPGDSSPIGPWPEVVVHCPAAIDLETTSTVSVWIHSHNMIDGCDTALTVNGFAADVVGYQKWDMGSGSWQERFDVDITGLGLAPEDTLAWTAEVVDLTDWSTYDGRNTTACN